MNTNPIPWFTEQRQRTFLAGATVVGIVEVLLGLAVLVAHATGRLLSHPTGFFVWLALMGVLVTAWARLHVQSLNAPAEPDSQ